MNISKKQKLVYVFQVLLEAKHKYGEINFDIIWHKPHPKKDAIFKITGSDIDYNELSIDGDSKNEDRFASFFASDAVSQESLEIVKASGESFNFIDVMDKESRFDLWCLNNSSDTQESVEDAEQDQKNKEINKEHSNKSSFEAFESERLSTESDFVSELTEENEQFVESLSSESNWKDVWTTNEDYHEQLYDEPIYGKEASENEDETQDKESDEKESNEDEIAENANTFSYKIKTEDDVKELSGCDKCNYKGFVRSKTGLLVRCSCAIVTLDEKKERLREAAYLSENDILYVDNEQKELIPKHRQKDAFVVDFVKKKISDMRAGETYYRVQNWDNYIMVLQDILMKISNVSLNNSFIIGAPNGFGKETFANTAIRLGNKLGMKMVPYITVSNLGALYESFKSISEKYLRYGGKKQEYLTKYGFNWKDYLEADIVILKMTSSAARSYETLVLNTLMNQRSMDNKPTIVMIEHSLEVYTMDSDLYQMFWMHMLAPKLSNQAFSNERYNLTLSNYGVDRLIHVSTFLTRKEQ